jgi:hypothetical protein
MPTVLRSVTRTSFHPILTVGHLVTADSFRAMHDAPCRIDLYEIKARAAPALATAGGARAPSSPPHGSPLTGQDNLITSLAQEVALISLAQEVALISLAQEVALVEGIQYYE